MWLIGMMGSGKTTVGREASSRLGVPFFDTDDMVVEMSRMPISAIWETMGESGFREVERRAVATVPESGFIASAGGGAILDPENREQIRRGAPVVWLRCQPEVLARRLGGDDTRPLLSRGRPPSESLAIILDERAELYSGLATHVVDTDELDPEQVIVEIMRIWEQ